MLRPGGRFVVVKDDEVGSVRSFRSEAEAAGFHVDREERVAAAGVRFTLWQCRA